MTDRQNADQIESEAARWVIRLDREEHTSALDAELQAWLSADTRRQGALLFAQASWRLLDGVRPQVYEAAPSATSRLALLPRRQFMGVAASVAAAAIGIAIFPWQAEIYQTSVGEIRRVPLADNSVAAINTASRLSVNFSSRQRRVVLNAGEAWFQVAHNRERPFLVEAGPIRVQAIGTAFSVRRHPEGADVLVTEGTVRAWVQGHETRAVLLSAGTTAFIADSASVAERPDASNDVDRRLAWRNGRVDLAGQTLSDAADEFNRYSTRQIFVADDAVGAERLYGVFRTDDPEGFARAAATSLRVGAHSTPSGDIVIEARQRSP